MPALDKITVEGFKSIASIADLRLGAISIVIGANGSGKSNFIGIFSFLHAVREGRLQEYVAKAGGAERILHFGSKQTSQLRVQMSFFGGENEYEILLQSTDTDELTPTAEWVGFWDKSRYSGPIRHRLNRIGLEAGISASRQGGIARFVREHLDRWRVYHFHDTGTNSPMKKTADVADNRFLRPDGANLSAFLYLLKEKHTESYSLIRSAVQRVAPFFDDFLLVPDQLNDNKIRLEWRHRNSDDYFDAAALSDGTLRFVALATLLLQPRHFQPSIIIVDEPELGLHPYAITILATLVKQASLKMQVILSTQSTLLLDHFEPQDVLVAERVNDGTRLVRPEPERLNQWLDDYSLGQLWEKNELGGRPARA